MKEMDQSNNCIWCGLSSWMWLCCMNSSDDVRWTVRAVPAYWLSHGRKPHRLEEDSSAESARPASHKRKHEPLLRSVSHCRALSPTERPRLSHSPVAVRLRGRRLSSLYFFIHVTESWQRDLYRQTHMLLHPDVRNNINWFIMFPFFFTFLIFQQYKKRHSSVSHTHTHCAELVLFLDACSSQSRRRRGRGGFPNASQEEGVNTRRQSEDV